jgi:uncharacterized membrane protein
VTEQTILEGDERGGYGLNRLLALSDGVFAIALTLLVLSLRVDVTTPASQLNNALHDAEPELYAYVLSVVVIAAFWMGHHRVYAHILRVDAPLLWMNVAFLGVIALIPYPTDLVGRYSHQTAAIVLYAAVISLGAIVSIAVPVYASRQNLIDSESVIIGLARGLPIAFVFLASIPVAVWSPRAAQYLWLLAVPARVVASRVTAQRRAMT